MSSINTGHHNFESTPLIILADDDPSIRLILHHVLQRDGYHVLDASDGREVLRLLQTHPASLVLLDAIMPEQDGFVTCRLIKEQQPDLPVLMITALDDEQSVERAFSVGADDYISKPVNWSVLKHRIARALALLTPRTALDDRIFSNQVDIRYSSRMNLADEVITAIEVAAELPLSILPGVPAMDHLIKSYCLGYQQKKYLYPDAKILSLPLWPMRSAGERIIDTLNSLDKKFGLSLNQLQLRVHDCHLHQDSLLRLLPLIDKLPVQLCIDAFSFSLRNLEFVTKYNCQAIMIDMAQTRKQLAGLTFWLEPALQAYKNRGVVIHACGVQQPDDMQLAISLGCISASGPAIKLK